MSTLLNRPVPVFTLTPPPATGNPGFQLVRTEGTHAYRSDVLQPHRKDYYQLVFVRRGGARHWVDMRPFVLKDNTFYFTVPGQLQVKEAPQPSWSTSLAFTREFMALQQNAALAKLPLLHNPQHGPEVQLTEAEVTFVEDLLNNLESEYCGPSSEWQQRMLSAYLTLLLTYLSRVYTGQFAGDETSPDQLLLHQYRAKIEESFREQHEVGAYASLLNISPGRLSEVVKAQSGKPAIAHIQERLVLEARRLLFHTQQSVKEIGFDLGFDDASYFTRFFKRETGLTPADYRASTRKMYL